MATRYFGGNSLAAFHRSNASVVEVTTAGTFDSAYVASAIKILDTSTNGNFIRTPTFSATGTLWVVWDFTTATSNTSGDLILLSNAGTNAFRITNTGGLWTLQFWGGASWTTVGTGYGSYGPSTRYRLALKIVMGTSMELFVGGVSVASGSVSGGQTTVTYAQFSGTGNGAAATCHVSQVMIADYDIRDSHLMASAFNGNSATNTGGTGAYTDINETVLDESTAEVVATVSNKMGQTHAAITVPSGLTIAAAVLAARGRVSGGTVTDGKLGIKSGGSSSSTAKSYTSSYEPRVLIQTTDPATSAAFTQSGYNSAETYLEAA
jgi:hypothetical protein